MTYTNAPIHGDNECCCSQHGYAPHSLKCDKCYAALAAQLAEAKHDIDAYRGALGYAVPGDHDGRLSDGSTPRCGICEALAAQLAVLREAAGKVVCQRCNDSGFEPWSDFGGAVIEPCPDCADLRALLERQP